MNRIIRNSLLGLALCGVTVVLFDALFLEKYFFQIKKFDIGKKEKMHKKIKLVLLSDLHIKHVLWPFYKKLAKNINQLRPDLLLITGDTLDESGETEVMKKFLSLLNPDLNNF